MPKDRGGTLVDFQRGVVIGVVSLGASLERAAERAGCSVGMIEALARRDPDFGRQLREAETHPEIAHLTHISTAAKDAKYWRAAAWALEHMYPENYALRRPRSMSAEQISRGFSKFAAILLDDIVDETVLAQIVDRLDTLAQQLAAEPDTENLDGPR